MKKTTDSLVLQRLMNARIWRAIQESGLKISELSGLTGLSRQTFYFIENNARLPSALTLVAVRHALPAMSMNALYSSEETTCWREPVSPPALTTDPAPGKSADPRLAAENELLRAKLEKLETQVETLQKQKDRLMETIVKRDHPEFSFSPADHPTHRQHREPLRFTPGIREVALSDSASSTERAGYA